MIFLVDSDGGSREATKSALEDAGYEVATFDSAESALDLMVAFEEPELIISEVRMPGMDGIRLKKEFTRQYPNSLTPFVFYSALGSTKDIMSGLTVGADDYLVKPMPPEVFRLKVRTLLSRRHRYMIRTFVGDLAKMPFFKLMQFCESKGLTGEVEIPHNDTVTLIVFRAGQLQSEGTSDETLLKIYDLTSGTFTIRALPFDYAEIMEFSAIASPEAEEAPAPEAIVYTKAEKPMGKLSGLQVEKRLFQFQTEFNTSPSNQIVTIVVLDGRVVHKRNTPAPPGKVPKEELERLIEIQHTEVEDEIKEKLTSLAKKKAGDTAKDQFALLFEEGFEKYRNEDYAGALAAWERAYTINPTDKSLETNIRILKKKLQME